MNIVGVVFAKEVRDNLRDRRTVLSTLLFGALLGPLIFAVIFNLMIEQQVSQAEAQLVLPIAGAEHAPNLIAYLRRAGVEITEAPAAAEELVAAREIDFALRIGPDYGTNWRAGDPAVVELIADTTRRQAATNLQRVRALLARYSQTVGAQRLQLRGIDPLLAQAVATRQVDVSTPQSRGAVLVGTLPFFLLMTVFTGGLYLAIDATSGEKERQSLEPLLINPVPRWQIMLGKVLAAALFSSTSLAIGLVAFHFAMQTIPAAAMGFQINLGWAVIAQCFLIAWPLTLIASCGQCILAAFARGFREAQAYASILTFVPMAPSLWLSLSPVKEQFWMTAVPLLSQVVLLNSTVRGDSVPLLWLATSWLGSLTLGLALCWVASGLYNRPGLVVSNPQ
ncbi:ABC transporter permease [Halieaceae bacterium IMCC14734]|uniref:ABC transporter permease n=1 Tax=Candidatus Litorirhabdus singularis TaxID=2518993 RepID=A0ABT3TDY9_9GAMM|nr:ABC transporter permease [Candidatus Litorirhabdus singularis]MCX2980400.1 ABC transporter permease [Candidatus Litorirhabdus singularis]